MTTTTTAPETTDPTIRRRPALAALATYRTYGTGGRDTRETITDLIADLAHLADLIADEDDYQPGFDVLHSGTRNYEEESTPTVDPEAGWTSGPDLLTNARTLVVGVDEWRVTRAELRAAEDDLSGGIVDWSESDDAGCEYADACAELLRSIVDAVPPLD